MYRYYQVSRRAPWQVIADGPDVLSRARGVGATALTVLAVNAPVDEDDTSQTLRYAGPLYFDIDCDTDLGQAIKSTLELVDKLEGMDVPRNLISLYASGSKGFHVFVPAELFRESVRARKELPYVYREMAVALYVTGMDFSVYATGRGNCWRVVNKQREDGAYRIPITYAELLAMNEPVYRDIVTNPRPYDTYAQSREQEFSPRLSVLFQDAERRQKAKAARQPNPIADDLLNKYFDGTDPGCISMLADYRVESGTVFNQAAFQLAIFLARTGRSTAASREILRRFAHSSNSLTYSSAHSRLNHSEALWKLMQQRSNRHKQFSCGAMRSLVGRETCATCPLAAQSGNLNGTEFVGLKASEDGYYLELADDKTRKLTTFTINPVNIHLEPNVETGEMQRIGCEVEFISHGVVLESRFMPEDCWDSKPKFLVGIGKMANTLIATFTGKDQDLSLLKQAVFHEREETMGETSIVHGAGIHMLQERSKAYGRVYVEGNFSLTTDGFMSTHKLHDEADTSYQAHLRNVSMPHQGDERLDLALLALMKTRAPAQSALLTGWHAACHFKTQLTEAFKQFPILSVWGTSGSGKTSSWGLFSGLNGVDPAASMFDCSLATQWAMGFLATSSVTVPVCYDEHNKNAYQQRNATFFENLLKAAYGSNRVGKGVVDPQRRNTYGAHMSQLRVTAPCVVISEAPLNHYDAMEQRIVAVGLTPRNKSDKAYREVSGKHPKLWQIARALMQRSLMADTSEVREYMYQCQDHTRQVMGMGVSFLERPNYNYACCFMGLGYLAQVCEELGLPQSAEHVGVLASHLDTYLQVEGEAIDQSVRFSQVSRCVEHFSVLAAMTRANEGTNNPVTDGSHYVVKGGKLLFLSSTLMQTLKLDRFESGVSSAKAFNKLVVSEEYFLSKNTSVIGMGRCVALSIPKMEQGGIDVSGFTKH